MGPRHVLTSALLLLSLQAAPAGAAPGDHRPAGMMTSISGQESGARSGPGGCRSGDGIVVCWEADPGLAGPALRVLEEGSWMDRLPGLGPPAGILPDTVRLWVVEDLDRAARRAGIEGGSEHWVAGFAVAERSLIVVGPEEAERGLAALSRLLRHELAHLALAEIAGGRAPRWLHEGYAQFAEGSWDFSRAWTLRLAFLRGEGPSLSELSLDFPRAEPAARMAYLLSYTAVNELASLSGEAGLRTFFDRLAQGADVDTAIRRTFGITQAQFEDRWRKSVGDRYGWLYLLTRAGLFWIVISLLLIFAFWNRRRYDRERMEELRARERREDRLRDRIWRGGWRWDDLRSGPWAGDPDPGPGDDDRTG